MREGKATKVPVNPRTGAPQDVTDARGWTTMEQAIQAAARLRLSGVGFCFSPADPFFGLDVDGGYEDGQVLSWAKPYLARVRTYTEISVSGHGLHAIGRGTLPGKGHRKTLPDDASHVVELYDRERFFVVTGRHLPGAPREVEERSEEVLALYRQEWPEEPPTATAYTPCTLDDATLIRLAGQARNGSDFDRLYSGDTSAYGNDHSRADMALCCHLAFWCGGDPHAVDRLFRRSSLYRPKWERENYRGPTIERAIGLQSEFYSSNGRKSQERAATLPEPAAPAPPLTEFGDADRLLRAHGRNLRWCPDWGTWLVWDGVRWSADSPGGPEELCKSTLRGIAAEAADCEDDDDRKALLKHALRVQRSAHVRGVITSAQWEQEFTVRSERLDTHPMLLNVQNGTVDLETGTLREPDRADLMTRRAPVAYDPDAASLLWTAFLLRVLPDEELRAFFQRAAGYTLTGLTTEQCFFFLFGQGANGKSVALNTLLALLGDYGQQAAPDLLLAHRGEHVPTDVAELRGRRFVATIEIDQGRKLAEGLVKQMTGGDNLRARFLRQDFFQFNPTHKVFMAANHKPIIRGTDLAIWRRIMLVPFTETIPEEDRDPRLALKLREALPAVLAWCVRGCLEWQAAGGLNPPAAVRAAVETYRAEQDVVSRFVEECCVTGRERSVQAGRLYQAYLEWCKRCQEHPSTQTELGRRLSDLNFESSATGGRRGRFRVGLDLAGESLDLGNG